MTRSANDIAAAVGENLGGSKSSSRSRMTAKARALGMESTTSGTVRPAQFRAAHDRARHGPARHRAAGAFPAILWLFLHPSFAYGKQRIGNHNRLLGAVKGVDGIKTGYTRASGFNLVSSVQRDGRSIVAVVLGGKSGASRNKQMTALIAKYLPKASRGGNSLIVAKSRTKTDFDTPQEVAQAEEAPAAVPQKRPVEIATLSSEDPVTRRIATAHVVSAVDEDAEGGSDNISAIEKKLREISRNRLPVPSPAPVSGQVDPIVTAAANGEVVAVSSYAPDQQDGAEQAVQEIAEPSQAVSGWQIQIGATPSLEGANILLEKARSRVPGALSQVANHTETVAKGGETLYRARFAGFQSKNDAQSACNQLKKKKFDCIAISN